MQPVTFTCRRISHKESLVTPRERETFCSKIINIGPQGFNFKEPVTVFLPHSAEDEGAYADYYDLSVQILNEGCKDLTTERLSTVRGKTNRYCWHVRIILLKKMHIFGKPTPRN